jgi:hypothetical protein
MNMDYARRLVGIWMPVAAGMLLGGCGTGAAEAPAARLSVPVALGAPGAVPAPSAPRLPLVTVFKGKEKFDALVARAEREGWRNLPLPQRTVTVGRAMLGSAYVNYTLEVDDHVESPVVNFNGQDCWTFYEKSLGFARMLSYKPGPYQPEDLLHMIELERYRNGRCTGSYNSRMHYLEEVFHDNQRRGLATNITPGLPGAVRLSRQVNEMSAGWKNYRYLRKNPSLVPEMARLEQRISKLPVYHIPASKVRAIEDRLQDGDICAITSKSTTGYTSHVGLIVRRDGRAWFMHATSSRDKGRQVVLDQPISDYLRENSSRAGIIICRPKELPASPLWQQQAQKPTTPPRSDG